jgi:hypothetical protein
LPGAGAELPTGTVTFLIDLALEAEPHLTAEDQGGPV